MASTKTRPTDVPVADFIESFVTEEQKKKDSYQLLNLMESWSGCRPYMWGSSIIGFGNYHYQYASGHEGDAPILAFSPRKTELVFYVHSNEGDQDELLNRLGKYRKTKGCLYVKRLSDINIDILKQICLSSLDYVRKNHKCSCHNDN